MQRKLASFKHILFPDTGLVLAEKEKISQIVGFWIFLYFGNFEF